jgi:protein TonB
MERLFADLVLSRQAGTARRAGFALPASLAFHAAALTLLVLVSIVTRDTLPPVEAPTIRIPSFMGLPPAGNAGLPERGPSRPPRPARPAPPPAMAFVPDAPPAPTRDDVLDALEGPPDSLVHLPCSHDCVPGGGPGGVTGGDPTALLGAGLPPPTATGPIRQGGDIRPPVKMRNVVPVYPVVALAARVQGVVVLDCTINTEGRVTDVKVLGGPVLLQAAAVDAVRHWLYRPTLLNGVAVPIVMTVTVRFTLGSPDRSR